MEHEMVGIEAENKHQSQEQESSAIFKKATRPITLKFDKVEYRVKVGGGGYFMKKDQTTKEKHILKGVSGAVFPGELMAMLGPSGSGKTTLLTALGGRLEGGSLRGNITYNDKPHSNAINRQIGFVTQDDILYPHLTVTETLVYTALLRLPKTIPKQEKIVLAQAVMSQLGLTKCKDSIIGQAMIKRGVSGGERKRVSIGQEMLINPSLLFLDEPTSGLDSTTAQKIVSTLWELVNGGRTIIMTIHQPSSKLFYMFHKVLLLSEGNPLYFGKGSEVMEYFESVGYKPQVAMNPSDFLLDIANGIYMDESEENDMNKIKANLVEAYTTNLLDKVNRELLKGCDHAHFQDEMDDKKVGRWPTTWWQQFSVLFQRGVKERRHEEFSKLKIGQVLFAAFMTGLVWFQCPTSDLKDRAALVFHIVGFCSTFPLFQAVFTFPQEKLMLGKERASGMYRLSSYFMAALAGDLPMGLSLPIAFVLITYFMAGLKTTAWNFIYFLLTILVSVLTSQGLGLAIGAVVMSMRMAVTVAGCTLLTFSLLGGFFVQNLPAFITWIKYISINYYTFKLGVRSQYEPGETYPCGDGRQCLVEEFPTIKPIGLGDQGISWIALLAMLVGYRLIAYIGLIRVGVSKVKAK